MMAILVRRLACGVAALALATPLLLATGDAESAPPAGPPPIRTSAANRVPACVTPERLMAFLATRNSAPDPRFKDIARLYKRHGETWRVRWDYAFFQMAIETNFLTYRRPNGQMGDVDPRQNNFAGIGTTGGGVPGDRYPDVSTGVLAQVQHLVVYSGERLERPVAPRTQLKQDDILLLSEPIAGKRPLTFADLSGRWAVDKAYGRSIEWVAEQFRTRFCPGGEPRAPATGEEAAARPQQPPAPAATTRLAALPPAAAPAAATRAAAASSPSAPCRVLRASYGGRKTLLVRAVVAGEVQLTALDVHEGFERSMAESYLRTHAKGGETLGEFPSPAAAVAAAEAHCAGRG